MAHTATKEQKLLYNLYLTDPKDHLRYALGNHCLHPLLIIGLNPSTANQYVRDQTLTRVEGFARRRALGIIMCNLYPLRCTDPDRLPKRADPALVKDNTRCIVSLCQQYAVREIWAAWGDPIEKRPYLSTCLHRLYEALSPLSIDWLKCGSTTRRGHPRHPSRLAYRHRFSPLNMPHYLSDT
ncbi:MAG: DUF1643 domain-containing protein [Candidatus Latescibacterota bacterium]|nr:DUF1643 domain-containing protein [Candidatus Latescibacterota bacterium]